MVRYGNARNRNNCKTICIGNPNSNAESWGRAKLWGQILTCKDDGDKASTEAGEGTELSVWEGDRESTLTSPSGRTKTQTQTVKSLTWKIMQHSPKNSPQTITSLMAAQNYDNMQIHYYIIKTLCNDGPHFLFKCCLVTEYPSLFAIFGILAPKIYRIKVITRIKVPVMTLSWKLRNWIFVENLLHNTIKKVVNLNNNQDCKNTREIFWMLFLYLLILKLSKKRWDKIKRLEDCKEQK